MNGRICCCSDLRLRNVLIKVIAETTAIAPNGVGDTSAAKRAYYAETMTRMIINVPSDEAAAMLGNPSAVDAYEVDNPTVAAMKAKDIFRQSGYEGVQVFTHLGPEFPEGFMVFVTVPELRGLALLYWPPKDSDPEALRKFRESGRFGPWTEAEGAIE